MLTITTPCWASASKSELLSAAVPAKNAPPWIHTITGSEPAGATGDHTLSWRQSSLIATALDGISSCAQAGPKWVASLVPFHGAGGAGARHRRSPVGGAA